MQTNDDDLKQYFVKSNACAQVGFCIKLSNILEINDPDISSMDQEFYNLELSFNDGPELHNKTPHGDPFEITFSF